jgi:hypothetical protein
MDEASVVKAKEANVGEVVNNLIGFMIHVDN